MAVPLRTCVGCRRRAPASELLRVVARDGALAPDPRRLLPGRGAHVHPDPRCLELAVRRRAFPRALRVSGPLDVTELRKLVPDAPETGPPPPSPRSARTTGRR